MKENQLIKYDKQQLERANNLIAITNKLLDTSNNLQKEGEKTDKRILAMMAIKEALIKARTYHAQKELIANKQKESEDGEEQNVEKASQKTEQHYKIN
jgi:hypothetical protein